MTKILITEFINQNSLENLNKKFDVNYDEKLCEDEKEIIKIIRDYDGLIVRNKTQVNSDILKNAFKLKFIGRLGVGLDNIDTCLLYTSPSPRDLYRSRMPSSA